MKTIAILACIVLCPVCAAAEPVPRKVLFFDLWKLDSWNNLELRQGEPDWWKSATIVIRPFQIMASTFHPFGGTKRAARSD